jgi:hypothetical protein
MRPANEIHADRTFALRLATLVAASRAVCDSAAFGRETSMRCREANGMPPHALLMSAKSDKNLWDVAEWRPSAGTPHAVNRPWALAVFAAIE